MGRKKKKVLLIDDEQDFCTITKMNLEETGRYEVFTQNDPLQGVETTKKINPDIVILDFRMPQMHGSDLAKELQKDPQTHHVPIIFLTGVATKEELASVGGEDLCRLVLSKPASVEQIVEAIEDNITKETVLDFLPDLFDKRKRLRLKRKIWKKKKK